MQFDDEIETPRDELAGGMPSLSSSSDLAASLDSYDDDIAVWINDLLDIKEVNDLANGTSSSVSDLTALDKHVQHLATRLDVAAQDTSSQLEQAIDDISRTIPRLTYDLQFMRESALALQEALQTIEKSREPVAPVTLPDGTDPTSTKQVLERLHYLDTVKTALEQSYSVLREAESWSTLDSEITTSLSSQAYAPAASRLSEASRSLALFSNTPEYESRRALMISLQNQLEAALSSALVAAINKRDVAACKGYYEIFSDIQREVEFRNYYFGSRRKPLMEMWSSAKLSDCEGELVATPEDGAAAPPQELQKLSQLLKTFFTEFNALLTEERTYTISIFPDPQQTLASFIQSTVDALTPSLAQRLSGTSEHYGPLALPYLIQAFKLTEEFAVGAKKILENAAYSAVIPTAPEEKGHTAGTKSLSRRQSKRMSLSRRMGPARSGSISGPQGLGDPIGGTGAWEQALYEPFMDFQAEYASLERKYLEETLKQVLSGSKAPVSDGATDISRVLRERSGAVFDMAEDTLERCMNFTHGYGALGLTSAFDHIFTALLDTFEGQVLTKKPAKAAAPQPSADNFQDLDYTPEDWEAFQQSLHILETCRAMRDRLKVVDGKMKATLLQFAGVVQLGRVDPTGLFISGTTQGEVQLLTQSTLNSAELHDLLEALIRESQQGVSALTSSSGLLSSTNTTPTPTPGPDGAGPSERTPILLKGASTSLTAFTKATQLFLQSIILSPLHAHLASYTTLSWTSQQRPKQRPGATYDMSIPTFSLSPTPTIQRVAEGLLNLPRMFELHADDDALAFSIETLPFVDVASLRRLLYGLTEDDVPEASPRPHKRRLSSASGSSSSSQSKPHIKIPPPQLVLTPEMVSSTWLSSLTLSLLSHLTSTVLPSIRILSQDGAAQLASDLAYLSNIVRAMNVEWDDLEKWKELSELNDEDGAKRLKETAASGEEVEMPLRLMAKMRGWRSE